MLQANAMLRFALVFVIAGFVGGAFASTEGEADHGDDHATTAADHSDDASHGGDHGDGHGDEKKSILTSDLGNVIWTLVIFGLVVTILKKAAWGPLVNLLNEREKSIRDSLETAQKERVEAERLLAEYKQQLDEAREQATAIVEEGRRDAEVVKRRIQDEARQESDRMIARAKNEIQLATDGAIKTLYDETAQLAVNAAQAIIGKELTASDHRQLVQESLEKMRQSGQSKLN